MKTIKEVLKESSLSKIWKYTTDFDTGALTAYRSNKDCRKPELGVYTTKENKQRNKSLLAKLRKLDYTVISVTGKYPEGGVVKKEQSFFVVDRGEKGTLKEDLIRLGKEFDQDSILFVEKGTGGKLHGTNTCPDNDISIGKELKFDKTQYGKEGEFYSSLIRGRPFFSEDLDVKEERYGNGTASIVNARVAEKPWQDLEVEDDE